MIGEMVTIAVEPQIAVPEPMRSDVLPRRPSKNADEIGEHEPGDDAEQHDDERTFPNVEYIRKLKRKSQQHDGKLQNLFHDKIDPVVKHRRDVENVVDEHTEQDADDRTSQQRKITAE